MKNISLNKSRVELRNNESRFKEDQDMISDSNEVDTQNRHCNFFI